MSVNSIVSVVWVSKFTLAGLKLNLVSAIHFYVFVAFIKSKCSVLRALNFVDYYYYYFWCGWGEE